MRYSGVIYNDITAAPGLSVTFFTQGCPHACPFCHNPDTWDFEGGKEFTSDVLDSIVDNIKSEGILRNLCIMGGEPLCEENQFLTLLVINEVKKLYPDVPVYIWTGYTYEELMIRKDYRLEQILNLTDYIIDGPYIDSLRDITLNMRGSSNQRIINLHEIDNTKKI